MDVAIQFCITGVLNPSVRGTHTHTHTHTSLSLEPALVPWWISHLCLMIGHALGYQGGNPCLPMLLPCHLTWAQLSEEGTHTHIHRRSVRRLIRECATATRPGVLRDLLPDSSSNSHGSLCARDRSLPCSVTHADCCADYYSVCKPSSSSTVGLVRCCRCA
jgi:hypothetical protein